MMNKTKQLWLTAGLLISVVLSPVQAATSAASTAISVNPSIQVFKAVAVNTQSSSAEITVKNTSGAALAIGMLSIQGPHPDQYQFEAGTDNCSVSTIAVGGECTVRIKYAPTSKGHKQALLSIPNDSADTYILQMFLTSREDGYTESSRRLPPVLYKETAADMDIPETMTAGQIHTLKWSILGYHNNYTSIVALFDCTNKAAGTCGSSYSENFYTSGSVASNAKVLTNWHNDGVYANKFNFSTTVPATETAGFTQETDIVVRFYRRNTDDQQAGNSSLSLLIPGNLSDEYYDKEGRRLKKKITP